MNQYYLYLLVNKRNATVYIVFTHNLVRRVYKHREGLIEGFSKKNNVKLLVYYEIHSDTKEAIKREKALKKRLRKWKIELIEKHNPEWKDLYEEIV